MSCAPGDPEDGDLIGIFPEGKITYDGQLNPFKPGVRKILDRTPVPVVPLQEHVNANA